MIFWLAPMDGITDCAYRIIIREIFDTYTSQATQLRERTEFMSADGYVHEPTRLIHHLMHTPYEMPLIAQIYGGNVETLLQTAQDIDKKYDFTGIELNIGCPSPKVMACGGGAWMLKDKKQTLQIIKTLSEAITKPFSFKTRAGLTIDDKAEQFEFIVEAAQYVHMLIIHGRTYKQSHSGEVDREFIYKVKQALGDRCVVIGNGGIKSYDQALQAKGELDGIMIGQAAIGNPRIFTPHTPSIEEIYTTALRHLDLAIACECYLKAHQNFTDIFPMPTLESLYSIIPSIEGGTEGGLRTPIEFRKYLFNYVTGLPGNKEFKVKVSQLKEYDQVKDAIHEYFEKIISSKEIS